MTPEEKDTLVAAVETISDPRGNWEYGWKLLCELAGFDYESHRAEFRKRSDEELRHLGKPEVTEAATRRSQSKLSVPSEHR